MMHLRNALDRDIPGAYRICLDTSDVDGTTEQWQDPELLGHVFVGPYFLGPDTIALTLVDETGIAGYCLGAPDTRALATWCESHWWPQLRVDYPLSNTYGDPEREMVERIHRPVQPPEEIVREFPAHLHIDLLARARGCGQGRALITRLLSEMERRGCPGVHLGVGHDNTNAISFYRHLGFQEVGSGREELYMARALPRDTIGDAPTGHAVANAAHRRIADHLAALPTTEADLPVVAPLRGGPVMRWGIIGPGEIAGDFAHAILTHTDQQIVAVGSRSQDRAARFADTHGIARAYGEYDGVLGDPNVDVVYIATPNATHRPWAVAALNAGRHVLIEKPLATDPEDANTIVKTARRLGTFAMEGMWSRFLPQYFLVERLIREGAIGDICAVFADFGADFSDLDANHPVFSAELGGGVLRDIGIYPLWLARLILGEHSAMQVTGSLADSGVDDQVGLMLDYPGGAQAMVHATMRAETPTTATICGTLGRIDIPAPFLMPNGFSVHDSNGQLVGTWTDPSSPRLRDGLAWEAVAVAQHIADGTTEAPLHTLNDALTLTSILADARRAVTGR